MASIDHVHIHASNPAKTIEFYESFFGAEVTQEIESVGRRLTIMSLGDKSKLSILHVPQQWRNRIRIWQALIILASKLKT